MHNPWITELARAGFIITACGLVGYAVNLSQLGIIIGLLFCLVLAYRHIIQFSRWLTKENRKTYSGDNGIIDDLYYRSMYLEKRHQDRIGNMERVVRRFQETARALPDAVIILNTRNEVEWLNKAARDLIGLRRKKDAGQIITNLIRHPSFNQYLMRQDFKYSIELPSPVNEDIQIRARIIPYGREKRLLVIRDVTQLHNLEKMRQEFIASTSHELRTPLTVIIGYLQSLEEMNPEGLEDIIKIMLEQSERMESIIKDMLLLARLESLENHKERSRKPVNIVELIDSITEEAKSVSSGQHSFKSDIDRQLNLVGIESELHSAFSNLLQNAIRYTPEDSRIKITWQERNGGAYFIVEDNGPGIAPEHLPRLTERFYRVDVSRSRESGGTGLGLAIVQQIVKHHEGQLLIESRPGKGSRFICEFPPHLVLPHPILEHRPPKLQVIR